ncbi:hypothetical protein EDB89DRAFT_1422005 [Lactarius sanguifluus]|nr:hypothetical protein EDB89DRAFT_1422005 [Lactarius sanguifluus]
MCRGAIVSLPAAICFPSPSHARGAACLPSSFLPSIFASLFCLTSHLESGSLFAFPALFPILSVSVTPGNITYKPKYFRVFLVTDYTRIYPHHVATGNLSFSSVRFSQLASPPVEELNSTYPLLPRIFPSVAIVVSFPSASLAPSLDGSSEMRPQVEALMFSESTSTSFQGIIYSTECISYPSGLPSTLIPGIMPYFRSCCLLLTSSSSPDSSSLLPAAACVNHD